MRFFGNLPHPVISIPMTDVDAILMGTKILLGLFRMGVTPAETGTGYCSVCWKNLAGSGSRNDYIIMMHHMLRTTPLACWLQCPASLTSGGRANFILLNPKWKHTYVWKTCSQPLMLFLSLTVLS